MSDTVIKVENISKQYRLGDVGTGALAHDVNKWWHKLRGKENPYLKIGETNDRAVKGESDYVWALKDINFEVKQGEVLGIIGRNGAGKSTLLKILSKTTTPTTGSIKIKGRIASLLEVGTGFHPELSGRDNIFLNGAILGMTKREIKSKFDEIVDFAGVERYIDTPVKRYSSGMYVRLAFGVAAHLEPEILIVDEVLAVGDAEFQKKALGKMKEVSEKGGRTVLFVSHNMAAIKQLCSKGIILSNGILVFEGNQIGAIENYQNNKSENKQYIYQKEKNNYLGNELFNLLKLNIFTSQNEIIDIESGFNIHVEFYNLQISKTLGLSLIIKNQDEIIMFELFNAFAENQNSKLGKYSLLFNVPSNLLNSGNFSIDIIVAESQKYVVWQQENLISFSVQNTLKNSGENLNRISGLLRPDYKTTLKYEEYI